MGSNLYNDSNDPLVVAHSIIAGGRTRPLAAERDGAVCGRAAPAASGAESRGALNMTHKQKPKTEF